MNLFRTAVAGAVLLALTGLFLSSSDSAAQSTWPAPPPGHPRLLLRASDIPALQARYASPKMAAVKELLLEQAAATSDGRLTDGEPSDTKRRAFEAKAFLYLVQGDTTAGRQAVDMALDYFQTLNPTNERVGGETGREMNRSIVGAAMVYDWCYDLFTAEQRQQLIADIKRIASHNEYGWPPPESVRFLTSHYGEDKHPSMLAAGIAVYDEDPSIYTLMAEHLYEGFVPARNFFYPGGKHHQGSSYGINRFGNEVFGTFLITSMGYPNPFVPEQRKVPYFNMYNRTPDGLLMPEGDDNSRRGGPDWYAGGGHVFQSPRLLYMLATIFQDPYLLDEALRYGSVEDGALRDAALVMVIWDHTLEPKPVSELPLTRYFGSPFGQMIARTGWDIQGGKGARTVVARMNVGEYYFTNHDHLDAGHFSLYYKGLLALDAGIYQGKYGYGSPHFNNYLQRSVAHNTLLILDPDEPLPRTGSKLIVARDGGQFWPHIDEAEYRTLDELLAHGRHAEILAHAFGPDSLTPDYSYLKGDLARSYLAAPPYPPKVSEVKRSFVFLNLKNTEHPAALIIFDRVVSRKPEFKKKWLLHSTNEPEVEGNVVDLVRAEQGYNGRLVNHTLLPQADNLSYEKIGGPGREFWSDGAQWPNESHEGSYDEPGAWRIELSPVAPSTVDHFLNVMQVMDAIGGPEPLTPEYLDTDEMAGVQIADRAVFFSKEGQRLGGELAVTSADAEGVLKYLVTDLEPGTWRVTGPVNVDVEATEEGGVVYFEGPSGTYTLRLVSSPTSSATDPNGPVPSFLTLDQNYPNPFNPATRIRYTLPTDSTVKLEVYNMMGQRVDVLVDDHQGAGSHEVDWAPCGTGAPCLASGIYFYRLQAGNQAAVREMVLLR